jgi:fermentation-respiration switch protein FrsA (DUF1100 family)
MVLPIIIVYITLTLLLYFFQDKLLYHPTPQVKHSYIEKSFKNDGETLRYIVLNPGKSNALIYFGGNGETVVYNSEKFLNNFPDYTIYLLNYRGYGGSSGAPSEKGFYSDALVLFDLVKKQHEKISIMGRSLGTGVATYTAANRQIEKLILVTPYDSIKSVAQGKYFLFPVFFIIKDGYNSIENIKHINAPTLIIIAENDIIIPLKNTKRLIKAFQSNQLKVETIEEATHNDLTNYSEYNDVLTAFLK